MNKEQSKHFAGISKEKFVKNEEKQINSYYNRYQIVLELYNKILDYNTNELPNIRRLRMEAERSYYYGLYSATILTISAAIETTLKTFIDEANFAELINKMRSQNYISLELKEKLHYLRKNTYNILKHSQSMASMMQLGWEKELGSKTLTSLSDKRLAEIVEIMKLNPDSEGLFSREYLGLEGIMLYYRLLQELKGRKRTNF